MNTVLKLTKRKPGIAVSLDTGKGFDKYLYTDTGEINRFTIAVVLSVEDNKKPKDKMVIDFTFKDYKTGLFKEPLEK